MGKTKDYVQLHLNILLFSLTGIFSKLASIQYNKEGLTSVWLYVFLVLMIADCGIYAIAWQKVIKKFTLSTAYANKSVYLIWSQIWAVLIFRENLTVNNIIGMLIVFIGVMVVQRYE
ncbi:EamA family transporter [Ruminococcus gauvreauii]|uniref:EamA family transporter n=1 Tax=Ruminococcus gauvreauii TaxID=438033 RepID=UPI003983E913